MSTTLIRDSIDELIGEERTSEFGLAKLVENGLPVARLSILKAHGVTFTEMSEIVISPRTLKHRKARGERLSDEETDRMVRVARIIALANSVFGDPQKALKWLRTESTAMGGRRPLSMLRTDAGGRLVEGKLWQIDEGMFA
jgi:putative toxin-antitoxin system antitoxin component (TIGR02293 family)